MSESTAQKVLRHLEAYQLKKHGANEYRCNSPLRPGSNSHAFAVKITGDEKGTYYDHKSHESGSLYDLAKALGIELPSRPTVADTKRPYRDMADYAKAHGIDSETLIAAGWKEVTYQNRPALEFVTKTGKRWRFLDDKKPSYKSPQGYEACWYGLGAKALSKMIMGSPLVICNGEISVVAAHHHGLAAIALTGGEKDSIPPHLLDELKDFLSDVPYEKPLIMIAMDCDSTGIKSAKGIEAQLNAVGIEAEAVDLGLSHKGDLADFCMLHTSDAVSKLLLCKTLPSETPSLLTMRTDVTWRIISAWDLKLLPPVKWLIEKEIQAQGVNIVYGPSGVGKSFYALDIALRLAQSENVIYMAGEGIYGTDKRISAWESHHQLTRAKLQICDSAVSLLDNEELELFIETSRSLAPSLIIVDTLARSMVGGDENSNRDMGLFIRACDTIKKSLGCAVMLVHHTSKQGYQERGASALRGAADVMIKVSDAGDSIMVEMDKVKDDEPLPPRYFQLLPVGNSVVFVQADRVIQTADDRLSRNQFRTLELASEFEEITADDVEKELHISIRSANRVLKSLRDLNFLSQDSSRSPHIITDSGRKRIQDSQDSRTLGQRNIFSESQESQESQSPESPRVPIPLLPDAVPSGLNHYNYD